MKRTPRKIRNIQTLSTETEKTIRSLIITLTLMIIVLGVVFLATTNESAQRGYALEQEKLKNEHLRIENEILKTKITKETSFSSINNKDEIVNMEEIENKQYITNEDNMVK